MSQKKRILLIEDEENSAALIKLQAENLDYQLHVEVDGINGFRAIEREKPDLVILDIWLPGQNGFDIVRKIKNSSELKRIPLIILSEKNEELDIVLGLELGADDYITKPFSVKILFSKIKAILRRKKESSKTLKNIAFSDFTLEVDKYILRKGQKEIPLTLSEFGILKRLLSHKNQVLSRSQLLDDINNDDAFIVDRNIDVHIASLRKKLGSHSLIETVRGIGYRYKETI
ncbi:MAG: Phosphate regulon transcriptional regulatory protein PhoB [Candidatus Anoxychlamydiales bacterium]|nr:Phosphate regulon transcriptional regulatory protein PhoB [Candidatus Anoxychlamydiales bacterium]NGX40678.1 Phosphate regulon transcriptional regulatory protein PhoB [Candidatus Anoxychlamydiales bacterium]HEU64837.1 response regulator transcription factor [Chlamydiota bacterium]